MSNTTIVPTLHVSLSEYQATVSSIHSLKSLYEYILLLVFPQEYFSSSSMYLHWKKYFFLFFICVCNSHFRHD